LGVFYSPNITPDPKFGIGRWSDEDFIRALRFGVSPGGAHYYPAFPYTSYTGMRDEDMRALKAHIFTLPPVAQANKSHELPWYLRFRPALKIWKVLYFTPGPFVSHADKMPLWNRGAYLAAAVAHCGECHTPRNIFGGFKRGLDYAGTGDGPEDSVVPNITRDKKTGVGRWSQAELMDYLQSGATPDGDYAGGLMGEVIDNSLQHLQKEDLAAIAAYIFSLPPIEHAVRSKDKKTKAKKEEFE
jgi:mono/diheme cytochrome c family protein